MRNLEMVLDQLARVKRTLERIGAAPSISGVKLLLGPFRPEESLLRYMKGKDDEVF